eukprot:TRINITY_DN98472_c0_g1_i1.p1 TRINITY_DN98472_c0_g1~~TRINITY_DN98472_c0_g1_i1.p1  ORF type:complete len:164 (-),score=15.32 TRINITY_DN98472_c0_g1_i1:40-507(-)
MAAFRLGFSETVARHVQHYRQSMIAINDIATQTVHGKHGGVTVKYSTLGRLESCRIDLVSNADLVKGGKVELAELSECIKQAVADANSRAESLKKFFWLKEHPQLADQRLPPYPFDAGTLGSMPAELPLDPPQELPLARMQFPLHGNAPTAPAAS